MKYTITLPSVTGIGADNAEIGVLLGWRKEIGDYVLAGEAIATVGTAEIASPAFGLLVRKYVLPGEAIEVGEPLALLSGVPGPLVTGDERIPEPFARAAYLPAGPEDVRELTPGEMALARHHVRSARTAPPVVTVAAVDVSEAVRLSERTETPLLAFVLHAAAVSLGRFPELNAQLVGETELRLKRYVHIGVPVRLPHGLAVLVLRDADRKSLRALARELADLRERAASSTLTADEQRGATFTVSQSAGVTYQTAILHQPQTARLTVGDATPTPVVRPDGTVGVRHIAHLCLIHDARLVPDETAAAFLADLRAGLEEAGFLFS